MVALSLWNRARTESISVTGPDSTRRSILTGGLAAVGAAGTGLALIPGTALGGRGAKGTSARRMKLYGRNWRARGESSGRGDCYGELLDGTGKKVGNFYSTNLGFAAPFDDDVDTSGLEMHVFSFTGGSLFGMGSGSHQALENGAFSIIGGTGRYAGATGNYLGKQHSVERGGDGSAEFTFSLSG